MPKPKNSPRKYDPTSPDIKHMGPWSWNTQLLWAKVQQGPQDQCWTFTGSRGPHANLFGARKNNKPQMTQAARIIYAEVYNIDVSELEIRHSCGNRFCCNWHHMYVKPNHMLQPKNVQLRQVKTRAVEPKKSNKKVNNQPWWQL